MTVNLANINAALGTVNTILPIALAAYTEFKSIWQAANPGKTEADYINYLKSAAQRNIDETAAQLISDGYVQQPDGSWKKP